MSHKPAPTPTPAASRQPPFDIQSNYDPYREGLTLAVDQSRPLNNPDGTVGSPPDASKTLTFTLDAASAQLAQGATVTYTFAATVTDVEQFSFSGPSNTVLFHQLYAPSTTNTFDLTQLPGYGQQDRQIVVTAFADVSGGPNHLALHQTPEYAFALITPKSQTTLQYLQGLGQQAYDVYQGVLNLAQQFGNRANDVLAAIGNNPLGFVETLGKAIGGALTTVLNNLTNLQWVGQKLLGWLMGKLPPTVQGLINVNFSSPNAVVDFLLEYAGLTSAHLQQVLVNAVGPGNVAVLSMLIGFLQQYDLSNPEVVLNLVQNLPTTAAQQLGLNDLQGVNLQTLLLDQATPVLGGLAVSVGKELAAKFVPGFSVVNTVINAVTWLLNNQSRLTGVITTVLDGLGDLAAGNSQALQNNLVTAFDLAVPAALDFAAAQFGLDALPGRLQAALQVVPTKVDDVLNNLVKALVGKVKAFAHQLPGAELPGVGGADQLGAARGVVGGQRHGGQSADRRGGPGRVLHLHVGGEVIRTTPEHPSFVFDLA